MALQMIDNSGKGELTHLPFEKHFLQMQQEYYKWVPGWQDLASFINPDRGFWIGSTPNKGHTPDYTKMIDSTAWRAARILAAGMQSGLTSPARPWFKLGVADPDLNEYLPVREYFDTVQQIMMAVFAHSNIYDCFYSSYEELPIFGTACSIIDENYKDIIRCTNMTCGQYMLDNGPDGRVDSFARLYWMNIDQLVKQFGIDSLTDKSKDLYKQSVSPTTGQSYRSNQLSRWVQVYHLIERNDERIESRKDFKGMPYRSIYWEVGAPQEKFLRLSGYWEFPIMAPRWDVIGSDVYGKNNPGRLALGDSKQLQQMATDKLIGLDKMVNPPMQKPNGVDYINALPNGVSPAGATDKDIIRPLYQLTIPFSDMRVEIEAVQNAIKEDFYVDLFLMIAQQQDPQETAYEVSKKYEEKLLMLGPVLERLYSEQLKLSVQRTYNILQRGKLLPPLPPELQQSETQIEFISVLAQAQKMIGVTPIMQTVQFVGQVAAVAGPDILDNIDLDEAVSQYAEMSGAPPKLLRDPKVVAQMRQQRQQAQAQQQMMQNGMVLTQGAKNLAQSDTGSNNALTALLGGPDALNGGQ
jgi:hypothetical protein